MLQGQSLFDLYIEQQETLVIETRHGYGLTHDSVNQELWIDNQELCIDMIFDAYISHAASSVVFQ